MKPCTLALAIALFFTAAQAFAHGGHQHEEEEAAAVEAEAPAAMDSIYAAGEEDAGPAADSIYAADAEGEAMDSPDLFSGQDLLGGEAPAMDMELMQHDDHSGGGHADHNMPEVELAEHEMVSPASKGYGVAAAITVLSGLLFGFLSFKRPNE